MVDESVLIYSLVVVPMLNQNPSKIAYQHGSDGLLTNICLIILFTGYCSKTDFWPILETPESPSRLKTPQDGSKRVSRRFQDGSRRLWTLPRRVLTQFTFGKKRLSVYNAQGTDQSPHNVVHSSRQFRKVAMHKYMNGLCIGNMHRKTVNLVTFAFSSICICIRLYAVRIERLKGRILDSMHT